MPASPSLPISKISILPNKPNPKYDHSPTNTPIPDRRRAKKRSKRKRITPQRTQNGASADPLDPRSDPRRSSQALDQIWYSLAMRLLLASVLTLSLIFGASLPTAAPDQTASRPTGSIASTT